MKIQTFVCALLWAALAVPFASADSKDTKEVKLTDAEVHVLAHLHHANQMEIDAGKLAQKKATAPAIKSYGQMLVKDHSQNDRDLTAFAARHQTKIPAEMAATDADKKDLQDAKDAMDRLRNMKGADFDREFLRTMVEDHDKDLAAVDIAIGQVTNPDLTQMLKDMKPVLQKHDDTARELQKKDAQALNP